MTFLTNWLALIAWRRSKGKHWTEQARLLYPVFTAARADLWVIPSIFALSALLLWPNVSALWFFTGIVSVLGAYAGTLPLDREVFPRISFPDLLRQASIGILLRFLVWFVFLGAAILMPVEFNLQALEIGVALILLWMIWLHGGLLWLGQKLSLFIPASERLQRIAAETSCRMNIPFHKVLIMRSSLSQAWAFPNTHHLVFTQRLLDLLSDHEIAAVCSHELAHLSESRAAKFSRFIIFLAYFPSIFFVPLSHTFGVLAFFILLLFTCIVPSFYRKISRRLELRADQIAKDNERDAGTYACALTKLYEDNLTPAVIAKRKATHPDLYDRLLAAGVTPDFPKPEPANAMAVYGHVFAGLMGVLFAIFAMRTIQSFDGIGR